MSTWAIYQLQIEYQTEVWDGDYYYLEGQCCVLKGYLYLMAHLGLEGESYGSCVDFMGQHNSLLVRTSRSLVNRLYPQKETPYEARRCNTKMKHTFGIMKPTKTHSSLIFGIRTCFYQGKVDNNWWKIPTNIICLQHQWLYLIFHIVIPNPFQLLSIINFSHNYLRGWGKNNVCFKYSHHVK
jgi:hypothetical protein